MKKDLQERVDSSSEVNKKDDEQTKTDETSEIYLPPVITYELNKRYYTFVHNQFAGETTHKQEMINALMRINYF